MSKPTIEDFIGQFVDALPADLGRLRQDVKKQLRMGLGAAFSRMDLVTREEFDIQAQLLARTRQRLENIQAQLDDAQRRMVGSGTDEGEVSPGKD